MEKKVPFRKELLDKFSEQFDRLYIPELSAVHYPVENYRLIVHTFDSSSCRSESFTLNKYCKNNSDKYISLALHKITRKREKFHKQEPDYLEFDLSTNMESISKNLALKSELDMIEFTHAFLDAIGSFEPEPPNLKYFDNMVSDFKELVSK